MEKDVFAINVIKPQNNKIKSLVVVNEETTLNTDSENEEFQKNLSQFLSKKPKKKTLESFGEVFAINSPTPNNRKKSR